MLLPSLDQQFYRDEQDFGTTVSVKRNREFAARFPGLGSHSSALYAWKSIQGEQGITRAALLRPFCLKQIPLHKLLTILILALVINVKLPVRSLFYWGTSKLNIALQFRLEDSRALGLLNQA